MKTAFKIVFGIAAAFALFRAAQFAARCLWDYLEQGYFSVEH